MHDDNNDNKDRKTNYDYNKPSIYVAIETKMEQDKD